MFCFLSSPHFCICFNCALRFTPKINKLKSTHACIYIGALAPPAGLECVFNLEYEAHVQFKQMQKCKREETPSSEDDDSQKLHQMVYKVLHMDIFI